MNSVLREEKKFLLSIDEALRLAHRLGGVMAADPHNGTHGYIVRSLYFDTVYDRDFYEKLSGAELRRKIRLRCYDPGADFAMLEIKQKQGEKQKKRSLRVARADAARIAAGDYTPLLSYPEPFAAECYAVMRTLCYAPKTVVEYNRKAFIAKENKIRAPSTAAYPPPKVASTFFPARWILTPLSTRTMSCWRSSSTGFC